jgi:hypothetical protein
MRLVLGDLWDLHAAGAWAVVPTNVGWKSNGDNVMGRGLALEARQRWPDLPAWYGSACRRGLTGIVYHVERRLVMFPTKPLLHRADPARSWAGRATLLQITRSAEQLRPWLGTSWASQRREVVMPLVGCGNGGLRIKHVVALLQRTLGDVENLRLVAYTQRQYDEAHAAWHA